MSSSKKKQKQSADRSRLRSKSADGHRRQLDTMFDMEKDWATKRLDNQKAVLVQCQKDPVLLLDQIGELLREQAGSHDKAGRTGDGMFLAYLGVYLGNLKDQLATLLTKA